MLAECREAPPANQGQVAAGTAAFWTAVAGVKHWRHNKKDPLLLLLGGVHIVVQYSTFATSHLPSLHLKIHIMSSLPPVYIVSAARTPTGMFLG